MKIIIRWMLLAAALLLVAHLYSGVVVKSFGSALLAAFVIGLFNTLLRPILVLLTLPVTLLTLGLFLFVINAAMFYAASSMLDGLHVTSFGAAQRRHVLFEDLFLEVLRAGRDEHAAAAQHRRHEIRHRLAGAGAGFRHEHAALVDRARHGDRHPPLAVAGLELRKGPRQRAVVGESARYRVDEADDFRYSGNV